MKVIRNKIISYICTNIMLIEVNFLRVKCPFLESLNRYDICHVFRNDCFTLMKEVIPEDDTRLYLRNENNNPYASFNENEITVSFISLSELIE